ncbi:MAG: DUF1287 domain-containing protein [Hyphomicrobiaceae bacterium]
MAAPRLGALSLEASLAGRWLGPPGRPDVNSGRTIVRPARDIDYAPAAPALITPALSLPPSVVAAVVTPNLVQPVKLGRLAPGALSSPRVLRLPRPMGAVRYASFGPAGIRRPVALAAVPSALVPSDTADLTGGHRRLRLPLNAVSRPPPVRLAALSYPLPSDSLRYQPRLPRIVAPEPETPAVAGPIATAPTIDGAACRPARVASLAISHRPDQLVPRRPRDADAFGRALAAAAEAQTGDLIVYTAVYRRIAYPRGDISPMHGSCSDVVVRAYRSLGIDLQEHVQRAGVGSGDPSIDHRRTETLRRLFAKLGAALPVTAFPEDYKPGDIVTYHRPHSRVSRAHIAIVSDRLAPTGRPMIVHNRGWGAQLEDALFADVITGHYRLTESMVPPESTGVLIARRGIARTPSAPGVRRSGKANPSAAVMRRTDYHPRQIAGEWRKIPN